MSSEVPRRASHLPIELLDHIICALPSLSSRQPCTLVCRTWATVAYPRVFGRIKLSESVLLEDAPRRGRYCVARLLRRLLRSSPLLPHAVKELHLDTFDSDGFVPELFKQVLERFPGLEVFNYDVRHFVLPPVVSPAKSPWAQPPVPISTRLFLKVHVSIGEFGTSSALTHFLNLFNDIEELSIGHLEIEDDGFPNHLSNNYRTVRARTLNIEHLAMLTPDTIRTLGNIIDPASILSIIDDSMCGEFIHRATDGGWDLSHVQHLAAWFPAVPPLHYGLHSFALTSFSGLRSVEVVVEQVEPLRWRLNHWQRAWHMLTSFLDALGPLSPRLHEMTITILNVFATARPSNEPVFYEYVLPDTEAFNWSSLGTALQNWPLPRPKVHIQILAQDYAATRLHFSRASGHSSILNVHDPSLSIRDANDLLQDILQSSISDPQVWENVSATFVL